VNANQLKNKLSNYNGKFYSLKGYNVASQLFNPLTQIISIGRFDNKQDALSYRNSIANSDEVFGNTNPELYNVFVISENNFEGFLRQKNLDEYLDYYRNYYQ
jgi:hypothetical protein